MPEARSAANRTAQRIRAYSTPAIILRRADFGEADRVLTILTPEHGLKRVLAKGVRRVTSRKAGHLELFARAQLLLARGRQLDLVTQAELLEPHRALREDLQRGALAHYICELAERFASAETDSAALFHLVAETLLALCEAADPLLIARAYELHLLTLEGYRPQLFMCALTNQPLEIDQEPTRTRAWFSPSSGGAVREACLAQARDAIPTPRVALEALRLMHTRALTALVTQRFSAELHEAIARVLRAYTAHVIEQQPRSAEVMQQIADHLRFGAGA
ncbi:MAG: DNA repair protein RecO [Thermoflexales bacterium]|nr:DNA repair protein RecO [Thermoflexales bacterium]MCS7324357.1 DNA repair protein RecO [Thermoflexales bacterium]